MLVTPVGMVMLGRQVQQPKRIIPEMVTLADIVMLVQTGAVIKCTIARNVCTTVGHWPCWSGASKTTLARPMLVTLLGIVTLPRLVQSANRSQPRCR